MSEHRTHENNKSSLFEKLPPDLRRAVNVAIIERVPPTYKAVWMQFELGKFGVSFTAFYRYARRLRDRVNLVEAAGLAGEDDAEVDGAIQKLFARRLLEVLLNSDGIEYTREIAALAAAHRQGAKAHLHDRRLAEQSRLAWARLDHDREQLRLKSELLQSAREGVLTLLDEAKKRRRPALDEQSAAAAAQPDRANPDAAPPKQPVESSR